MSKLLNFKNYLFFNIIFILILSFTFSANSQDFSHLKKANELYKAEKYNEAVELYKTLEKQDIENSDILFNIGNCYYRLEEVGKSILYYEKALKLIPSDEDIKFNLKIANLKTIDKFNTKEELAILSGYYEFINKLHSNTWLFISILMLIIALTSLYFVLFRKDNLVKKFSFSGLILGVLLFLTFTLFSYNTYISNTDNQFAILLTSNTYVKSSPENSGKNLIMIHEGLKLEILESNDNWTKVKLPDGNIGWLESNQIGKI